MRKYVSKFVRFSTEQQMLLNIADLLGKQAIDADGTLYKAADIEALVQQRLDARTTVNASRIAFEKAVEDERRTLDETDEALALIRDALLVKFRSNADGLAKVGLAPRKRRKKLTLGDKVAAAAKAHATREGHTAPAPARAIPPTPITPPAAPVVVNGANGSPQQ